MGRFILAFSLLSAAAFAAALDSVATGEIEHLLMFLKTSGCRFNRNGSWYEAGPASAHLQKKYLYLLKQEELTSTESFVEKAASSSSMSGKAYLVSCPGRPEEPSGQWFAKELERYRHSHVSQN